MARLVPFPSKPACHTIPEVLRGHLQGAVGFPIRLCEAPDAATHCEGDEHAFAGGLEDLVTAHETAGGQVKQRKGTDSWWQEDRQELRRIEAAGPTSPLQGAKHALTFASEHLLADIYRTDRTVHKLI